MSQEDSVAVAKTEVQFGFKISAEQPSCGQYGHKSRFRFLSCLNISSQSNERPWNHPSLKWLLGLRHFYCLWVVYEAGVCFMFDKANQDAQSGQGAQFRASRSVMASWALTRQCLFLVVVLWVKPSVAPRNAALCPVCHQRTCIGVPIHVLWCHTEVFRCALRGNDVTYGTKTVQNHIFKTWFFLLLKCEGETLCRFVSFVQHERETT